MLAITLVLALLAVCSVLLWLGSAYLAYRQFGVRPQPVAVPDLPPVSLLIPVCGVDVEAERNWESLLAQDYPCFEVLFGVLDPADPSVPVIERLVERHPGAASDARRGGAARLVPCPVALGVNHQVSNLIHLSRAAAHDFLVITDSDMCVEPEYLRLITGPLHDPTVGLVTCGYGDPHPASLGAALATLGRLIDFLPQVLVARALDGKLRFALGATLALRRDVLERMGGLESIVNRIGSDFHVGRLASEAGYRVVLSPYLLRNYGGPEGIGAVFKRELRWARTIRMNRGAQYLGVGITFGLVYGVLLLVIGGSPWTRTLGAAVVGIRFFQAAVTLCFLRCPSLLKWLWLLPARDLLTLAVWATSLTGNGVSWRGRRLSILPGGLLSQQTAGLRPFAPRRTRRGEATE